MLRSKKEGEYQSSCSGAPRARHLATDSSLRSWAIDHESTQPTRRDSGVGTYTHVSKRLRDIIGAIWLRITYRLSLSRHQKGRQETFYLSRTGFFLGIPSDLTGGIPARTVRQVHQVKDKSEEICAGCTDGSLPQGFADDWNT